VWGLEDFCAALPPSLLLELSMAALLQTGRVVAPIDMSDHALAMQPAAELPRRAALLAPLQALVLPKRWGRDAMYAALQAALDALQVGMKRNFTIREATDYILEIDEQQRWIVWWDIWTRCRSAHYG
jgi:hypothetical protein